MTELLDELYELVKLEEERDLTEVESARYVAIVDKLRENDVEIPFAIQL